MSSIPSQPTSSAVSRPVTTGTTNKTTSAGNSETKPTETASPASGDTVDISDEARALAEAAGAEEASEATEPYKPFSIMNPEKVLVPDTKAEKEYRELLKKVKSQKSGIMSQIKDILSDKGIKLDSRKLKIEVKQNGTIVVGGIEDKALKKAVTDALNSDKSLGPKLKEFQKDERDLSKLVKDYTGCSLYELTQTAKGDINKRVKDTVLEVMGDNPPRDEYYYNLHFLGETTSVINLDDVMSLAFTGGIDFSGELTTMAEPERNIKDSMKDLQSKVNAEFGTLNKALEERGLSDKLKGMQTLDLSRAKITIDSHGAVVVEGLLADDKATHDRGVAIIQKLAMEMLNEYDSNSYHKSRFTDASEHMIDQLRDELGLDEDALGYDARVVATLSGGTVGDVRVESPKTEENLTEKARETVNTLLREKGITVKGGVDIEVDENGKLIATNLQEGSPERQAVQELLDQINSEVAGMSKSDRKTVREKQEEEADKDKPADAWQAGIADLATFVDTLKGLRK